MDTFNKREYDLNLRKKALKEKKKAQFNTDLEYNEKKEIDDFLKEKKMSRVDFIRSAFIHLKKGCFEMKIENLYKINELNEKTKILLNNNINSDFYDFYFEKDINWLIENENKINDDYNNNIDDLKFDIILNSELEEKSDLILSLKNVEVAEFSKYINYVPFEMMKKSEKNKTEKIFNDFKSIKDKYDMLMFFNKICRK